MCISFLHKSIEVQVGYSYAQLCTICHMYRYVNAWALPLFVIITVFCFLHILSICYPFFFFFAVLYLYLFAVLLFTLSACCHCVPCFWDTDLVQPSQACPNHRQYVKDWEQDSSSQELALKESRAPDCRQLLVEICIEFLFTHLDFLFAFRTLRKNFYFSV